MFAVLTCHLLQFKIMSFRLSPAGALLSVALPLRHLKATLPLFHCEHTSSALETPCRM